VKRYELSSTDLSQYTSLTDAEREAWLHPEAHSFHSLHVERMGQHTFRWRDSREGKFYVGTIDELSTFVVSLSLRKLDPHYEEHVTPITLLSQSEIDDLFGDL
jgi:hypothetical protein